MDYLKNEQNDLMPHFPYSPELASNDCFFFSFVKNKLRGQRFIVLKETLMLKNVMFLQYHFQSGTNILKIGLLICKRV